MLTFRTKMRLSDIEAVRRISSSTKLFDHNDVEITASLAEEALELQQNPQWRDAAHDIRFILPSRTVRFALMFAMGGFRIQIRLMNFIGWQQINSFRGRVSAICFCSRLSSSFVRPAAAKFILKPKDVPVIIRPMSFITAAV